MAGTSVRSVRPGVMGWMRIVPRVLAMAALLSTCVPLHYLSRLLRLHNPWPRVFLGGIARIAGVRLRVDGALAPGGRFLLANHVSWLDIPLLSAASGTAFVAHDGLASVPLIRWLCAMNDTVFIARHDRRSVAAQVEQVREALSDTGALAIFPEGTTSDGTDLLPFKSSLLSALFPLPAGIAIQPVLIDYGPDSPALAWVGQEHGVDNFLKILARSESLPVRLTLLPPLSADSLMDRKALAIAAREAMAAELSARRDQRVAL